MRCSHMLLVPHEVLMCVLMCVLMRCSCPVMVPHEVLITLSHAAAPGM